jgi:hypothetical protein
MSDGCVEGDDLNEKAVICFEQEQRFLKRAMLGYRVFQQHTPRRKSRTVVVKDTL